MQAVGTGDITVHYQRGTALIGAYLGIRHGNGIVVDIVVDQLAAIVKVHVQLLFAGAFHPPLPSGQDVLDVDVGPGLVSGNSAVHKVLHAVTGVEIGVELGAVDDGTLGDKVSHADPSGSVCHLHIGTAVTSFQAGIRGIFLHAGEEHSFALGHHPLELIPLHGRCALSIVEGNLVHAALIPVTGGEQGYAGAGVAGFIIQVCHIAGAGVTAAELVLVALCAEEDALKGVNADLLSICDSAVYRGFAPAIVDEHRVVDLSVNVVLQPLGLRGVKAAVGVIPLGIQAGCGQLSHKGFEILHIAFFLVQEVAVKAHILSDLDELVCNGELAVLVLFNQVSAGLAGTERRIEIDTGDGHHAVFMSSIGISRVGDIHNAELKAASLPVAGNGIINCFGGIGSCCAVPGREVVGILPEVEHMLAEFIGIHSAVEKAVAVVTLHQHDFCIGIQIRLGLGCFKCLIALLQRNLRSQELCIGIGFRTPVFDVLHPIARKAWLRRRLVVGPGIGSKRCKGAADTGQYHGCCQKRCTDPFGPCGFLHFHFPFLKSLYAARPHPADVKITLSAHSIPIDIIFHNFNLPSLGAYVCIYTIAQPLETKHTTNFSLWYKNKTFLLLFTKF